jgi:hypothetical protein
MLGELLTIWTIRLALAGYFIGLSGLLLSHDRPHWQRSTKRIWTLGCLFYLAHFASAFQFYHGWSHQSAMVETANQAREVVDFEAGYGIYMNYLFTFLWALDAIWLWIKGPDYFRRPKAITIAVHAYLLFIVVNGTVVFEGGAVRWLSLVALFGLAILWGRRMLPKTRFTELRSPQA